MAICMNKENKYYTPEIEDFHVGFEFEAYNSREWFFREAADGWVKMSWEPRLASNNMSIENIAGGIQKEWIRVKYLPQEDVESLGWKYTGRSIDLWFNKVGMFDSASGTHRFTELKLHFGPEDHVLYINAYFGNQDEGCLFEGIIRNKSELRKLMKQLKIEEVPNAVS